MLTANLQQFVTGVRLLLGPRPAHARLPRCWTAALFLTAWLMGSGEGRSQARPAPSPALTDTCRRLLGQIQKIPIFDHHAHPGYFDDPDWMPWWSRPAAWLCGCATRILSW